MKNSNIIMSDSSFQCGQAETNKDSQYKENNRQPTNDNKQKLNCIEIFRTLVNNQRSTRVFWLQAFLVLCQSHYEDKRKFMILLCWAITQASYWIMCLFRSSSIFNFVLFEVFLISGTYISAQLLNKRSMDLDKEQDLPEFIIDLCN